MHVFIGVFFVCVKNVNNNWFPSVCRKLVPNKKIHPNGKKVLPLLKYNTFCKTTSFIKLSDWLRHTNWHTK